MIRLMLFDGNRMRRQRLEAILSMTPRITCVGSFGDGSRLFQKVKCLKPDVILMELGMPGMDGITATRIVKGIDPSIKVIIQTAVDDEDNIFNSLRAGAEGYILKDSGEQKVLEGIVDVINGGAVFAPAAALRVARHFNENPSDRAQGHALTPREREVLSLLTEGMSYKMAAACLDIGYNTVNTHIKRIYVKLKVNSIGEAVSKAIRDRIV
jgi:DNA-binding NarL/FixJ family response regulator